MAQGKSNALDIRKAEIKQSVESLDNMIRAEYNTTYNFLEYYAGQESISKVCSVKNQVIYGRRGTGKTHLLKALQEQLLLNNGNKILPVYVDVRKFKPLLSNDFPLYYSLILFRELVIELLKYVCENIDLLNKGEKDHVIEAQRESKMGEIQIYLEKFNAIFNGSDFQKLGEIEFSHSEMEKLSKSFNLSSQPNISSVAERDSEVKATAVNVKYISFAEMTEVVNNIIDRFSIDRMYILIDEWSEIPIETQPFFAELLKRSFITSKVTLKIAAIPNRTRLMIDQTVGLEDGGDIFGYPLDNRYIYELNQDATKVFFNELLFKQLSLANEHIFERFYDPKTGKPIHNFINLFLANQALREILIASAGIPRDFLNIFISSYNNFIMRKQTTQRHLALVDVRNATIQWYDVDKKKAVESNPNAKIMLNKIIEEILIRKKRCHFLIPEKYEKNQTLNDLIDLRVIHLRKRGIAHKGNRGVSYNVYYIDYACYTSSNLYHNKIITNLLSEIETIDDFRTIRRISLEDKFFDAFNAEVGNSFKCPHCGLFVDTSHPAYVKQKLCNNCFEKIEK